jgi:2-oxoglutarate ferredoxin oxidoreductase subunit beta
MAPPAFPTPIGVIRMTQKTTFDALMNSQIQEAIAKSGEGDLDQLLHRGDVWTVQ